MSKLKFDPLTPLYLSDDSAWRMDQFSTVFDRVQATEKPVVFFVHGRGKEPQKSLHGATFTKGMAVHKIELGYNVSVLMFNWDSAFKGFSFLDRDVPLSHTQAGAESLGSLLQELQGRQTANPGSRKPTLLVHSMGSVVIQKTIEADLWPKGGRLFTQVLFSQPDADDVGHAAWLDKLAARERVLVTLNKDDHVLRRSTDARPVGSHALGLGTGEPLAANASYVDLSRIGPLGKKDEDHEVFGKGAMNGQIYVCRFFTQALRGEPVSLKLGADVESIERDVIFRLKNHLDPGALCLKQPHLPGD